MDLDSLIGSAAPPATPRTADLQRELTAIVDAARDSGRPRRARRFVVAGGVAALILGGTAATTAAVGPSAWTSWLGDGQKTCQLHLLISPAGPDVGTGEPNMWPTHIDYARRARMITEARRYADTFDYGGIDRQAAVGSFRAQESQLIAQEKATELPDEVRSPLTGDALTSTAITVWVLDHLESHLAAEGYDMGHHRGSDLYLFSSAAETACR